MNVLQPSRFGFTLIELLLVLALLVVIAGFTAAALDGSIVQARLREGTERVRAAWSDARVQTIASGERTAFTCLLGGSDFRLSTCTGPATPAPGSDDPESENGMTGQLPQGVTFYSVRAAPSNVAAGLEAVPPSGEGAWSAPIVFNPDGTSYDAVVVLQSESGRRVELALRGITCTANVNDVQVGRELER